MLVVRRWSEGMSSDNVKGLVLAISSSLFIGASFIVRKKGLKKVGASGVGAGVGGYSYLLEPLWWAGMITMIVGEIAYAFAPAILVTPLGALSIIIRHANLSLKFRLHTFGILGCVLCVVGSTTIVLHAPPERQIESVAEVWALATEPAAIQCLKRNRLYKQEIEQLGNFQFRIHDQMIMLECAKATTETVDALRIGAAAMKAMHKATTYIWVFHEVLAEANSHSGRSLSVSSEALKRARSLLEKVAPNVFITPPSPFSYKDNKQVPWRYDCQMGEAIKESEEIDEVGYFTRSGRCYSLKQPKALENKAIVDKGKKVDLQIKEDELVINEPVTKNEAVEFLKFLKHIEYNIVEQLHKLHALDNGSSLNVMPLVTLKKLLVDSKLMRNCQSVVRAFDGTKREILGEMDISLTIGPTTYEVEFLLMDIIPTYNFLLGRPWIHHAGAVPSTLHQRMKFVIDGSIFMSGGHMFLGNPRNKEIMVMNALGDLGINVDDPDPEIDFEMPICQGEIEDSDDDEGCELPSELLKMVEKEDKHILPHEELTEILNLGTDEYRKEVKMGSTLSVEGI
ncbi:putative magnesium transporter NIPA3 [Hibiscus syriacus]|uniref:Magnesium transporter NIPA3 n=1 Tax=Hibiscus syriacus TaxID=106335 RepID=A0A6A3CJV9_HIBSY|nr:putative magnesium transporter NIPA3 [Hibiscus syriacus]